MCNDGLVDFNKGSDETGAGMLMMTSVIVMMALKNQVSIYL